MLTDSVLRMDKNYYPQVFLEKYRYIKEAFDESDEEFVMNLTKNGLKTDITSCV